MFSGTVQAPSHVSPLGGQGDGIAAHRDGRLSVGRGPAACHEVRFGVLGGDGHGHGFARLLARGIDRDGQGHVRRVDGQGLVFGRGDGIVGVVVVGEGVLRDGVAAHVLARRAGQLAREGLAAHQTGCGIGQLRVDLAVLLGHGVRGDGDRAAVDGQAGEFVLRRRAVREGIVGVLQRDGGGGGFAGTRVGAVKGGGDGVAGAAVQRFALYKAGKGDAVHRGGRRAVVGFALEGHAVDGEGGGGDGEGTGDRAGVVARAGDGGRARVRVIGIGKGVVGILHQGAAVQGDGDVAAAGLMRCAGIGIVAGHLHLRVGQGSALDGQGEGDDGVNGIARFDLVRSLKASP